jgi:hypothetical protein
VVPGRCGETMSNPNPTGGWKKGQSGNPKGRTPKSIERAKKRKEMANMYAPITIENCTPDDWKEIVDKAVEDAIHGDRYARDWLTKIVLPQGAIGAVPHAGTDKLLGTVGSILDNLFQQSVIVPEVNIIDATVKDVDVRIRTDPETGS